MAASLLISHSDFHNVLHTDRDNGCNSGFRDDTLQYMCHDSPAIQPHLAYLLWHISPCVRVAEEVEGVEVHICRCGDDAEEPERNVSEPGVHDVCHDGSPRVYHGDSPYVCHAFYSLYISCHDGLCHGFCLYRLACLYSAVPFGLCHDRHVGRQMSRRFLLP